MKLKVCFLVGALGVLITSGCNNVKKDEPVVAERYVHKYGYALTKEDWESNNYPGQVITTLRNGVTVTSTFENGVLHGASTHTFPNSQTVQSYFLYNQGEKVKEIQYDIQGMPMRETLQVSPTRVNITTWYADGTPLAIEEYVNDELLDGQYFTQANETEARVEKGNGLRICRDRDGVLLSKDDFNAGYMTKRCSFFANNTPESVSHYKMGKLHGEKRTYTASGEPQSIEQWIDGKQHGKFTYYRNGTKDYVISYVNGKKHGSEIHYIDGETVLKEIPWFNGVKHGPSNYYVDGIAHTEWFYDGKELSEAQYLEELRLDEKLITRAQEQTLENLN